MSHQEGVLAMRIPGLLRVFREYERAAVFRLGRFQGIVGPGLVFSIPIIDRMVIVNLDKVIPEWRGLSAGDLTRYVQFLVFEYFAIPGRLSVEWIREEMTEERAELRKRAFREAKTLDRNGDSEAAVELLRNALRVDRDAAERNLKGCRALETLSE